MPAPRAVVMGGDLPPTGVYQRIHGERERAHRKHGARGNSRENATWNDPEWLAVVGEEYGEVCHELTYDTERTTVERAKALRDELIQVAAMSAAWVDSINRYLAHAIVEKPEPMGVTEMPTGPAPVPPRPGTLEFDIEHP